MLRIFLASVFFVTATQAAMPADDALDAMILAEIEARYPSAIPVDAQTEVAVLSRLRGEVTDIKSLSYDPRTGRFKAAGVLKDRAQRIFGTVSLFLPVVVPARRVQRGEVLSPDDLDMVYIDAGQVHANAVTRLTEAQGMEVQRHLVPGEVMSRQDLGTPTIVHRNTPVTLYFVSGGLRIRGKGKALEDGSKGELIRVQNLQSGRVVTGQIESASVVMLSF